MLSKSDSHILIIVGMHRSGTSLLTSWLRRCGLHIGVDLFPAGVGNPLGHFENEAFLNFHYDILKDYPLKGFLLKQVRNLPQEKYDLARQIVAREGNAPQWGWKDPRTCLFLEFWKEILPDARFLCVFRHPAAVADSFARRSSESQAQQGKQSSKMHWRKFLKQQGKLRQQLEAWTNHNQAILRVAQTHPKDMLLLKIDDFSVHSHDVVRYINQCWGFALRDVAFSEVYQPKMLRNEIGLSKKLNAALLLPSSMRVYTQLERCRTKALQQVGGACPAESAG